MYSKTDYTFVCSAEIVLGEATERAYQLQGGLILRARSHVTLIPKRVIVNAPIPNMLYISEVSISNTSVFGGTGFLDANVYWNKGKGNKVDWPIIQPAAETKIYMWYNGMVPHGQIIGAKYIVSMAFIGPVYTR
jgi:hypothetical protein